MKEKIINVLNTFAETYSEATQLYKGIETQIIREYREEFQADKLSQAKDVYENTLSEARKDAMSIIDAEMDTLKSNVISVTNKPIPDNFNATLSAIKALQTPTQAEIDGISSMYWNNYICYRSLCDVLKNKGYNMPVVKVDDVLHNVEEVRATAKKAIYGEPNSYNFKAIQHGSILGKYENYFNSFLAGRFDEMSDNNTDVIDNEK